MCCVWGGFSEGYQLSLEAGVGGVTGVPDKDKTWLSPWLLLCLHNNLYLALSSFLD